MIKKIWTNLTAIALLISSALAPTATHAAQPTYSGALLLASDATLSLQPGESSVFRLGYKNTGSAAWNDRSIEVVESSGAIFTAPSWEGTTIAVHKNDVPLESGRLELYDVPLVAPAQSGDYHLTFRVLADGSLVSGTEVALHIVVGSGISVDAPVEFPAPPEVLLPPEPMIRVALGKTEGATSFQVSTGSYQILKLDGTLVDWLSEGDKCFITFDPTAGVYILNKNGFETMSDQAFRISADTPEARFLLVDKAETAKWNNKIVYNEYRGSFEMRWSGNQKSVYMINELPIEQYLRGLIETGNSEPMELHKAVYTAARSYAYTYLPDGVRAPNRLYDVHATLDQYYKGYAAEKVNPNGMKALEETRGLVVTFEGKPVITPYFTRSNGKTKTWKSVWGGTDKPWLKPVVAKYDAGKKMLGHGVGMSNQDAKQRILKDKWTFDRVLGYYYTNTELQKMYQ